MVSARVLCKIKLGESKKEERNGQLQLKLIYRLVTFFVKFDDMYVCFMKTQALKNNNSNNQPTNKQKNPALLCVIRHDCVTDSLLVSVPSRFF